MSDLDNSEGVPCGSDAAERNAIIAVLTWRIPFFIMSEGSPMPALYGRPGSRRTELFVYGNYSAEERRQICAATRLTVTQLQTRPVDLYFYPRELENEDLIELHHFCNPSALH